MKRHTLTFFAPIDADRRALLHKIKGSSLMGFRVLLTR